VDELGSAPPPHRDEHEEPDDAAIADEIHDFEERIDEVLRRVVSTQAA
jgi:hypothetical protein